MTSSTPVPGTVERTRGTGAADLTGAPSAVPAPALDVVDAPGPGFRADQLEGFRIGVTSDRRSSDLIDAFERRGAKVMHAPTLRISHAQQEAPLLEDTRAMIAAVPDVLLATTGYGVRRWFEVADAAGLGPGLLDALAGTDVLVRGPKARGGIRAAGLNDAGMSDSETTASLVDKVLADYPPGLIVGIQVHGYTDEKQLDRLRAVHRQVITVAPYRWTAIDDTDERVQRLVEAICTQQLDCVTFTSAPAVDALFVAAEGMGVYAQVVTALRTGVRAAAVGPVTAAPLLAVGIEPIQPERFRMGALIRLVCEHLEEEGVERIETRHGPLALRGSVVEVGGERRQLPPSALTILRCLVAAHGGVVTREDLTRALTSRSFSGPQDDHAMEVSLSRLRQALGVPGLVATVVKRGYRLDV